MSPFLGRLKVGLSCLLAIIVANSASAATHTATYVGFVSRDASNGANLFGGGSLNGRPFSATFSFDPDIAPYKSSDASMSTAYGGSLNGLGPFSNFSLTINGLSESVSGTLNGSVYRRQDAVTTFDAVSVNQAVPSGSFYITSYLNLPGFDNEFDTQGTFIPIDGPNAGSFYFGATSGTLNIVSATYAIAGTPSATPETATWSMMIVGFGWVGGAQRRRRQKTHAGVSLLTFSALIWSSGL